MRVLAVDEELPYPLDSGKRIRTWSLLSRLAKDHDVALVHPRRGPLPAGAPEAALAARIHLVPVDLPPLRKSGPRFAWDLARNVALPVPYMVMAHRSAAVRRAVLSQVRSFRPDLVHVEWTPLVANVPRRVSVPVCVTAHNVETDIWFRTASTPTFFARDLYVRLQARKVARFERAALARADAVIAVSDGDAARIREWTGNPRVFVVENGVDATAFAPDPTAHVDAEEALFVGSLDWRPNQDAVLWFLEEVFPRLKALRPSATFRIVGRSPPWHLQEKARSVAGVSLDASVPDVRPFVARAAVSVVPLRIGGGSRLKICEALSMARPVVSTSVGAEGLAVEGCVEIADGAEAFAAAVARTMADPAPALLRAKRGRDLVVLRHDWGALAPKQAAVWSEVAARRRRRP